MFLIVPIDVFNGHLSFLGSSKPGSMSEAARSCDFTRSGNHNFEWRVAEGVRGRSVVVYDFIEYFISKI